jgi:hypothetical protein
MLLQKRKLPILGFVLAAVSIFWLGMVSTQPVFVTAQAEDRTITCPNGVTYDVTSAAAGITEEEFCRQKALESNGTPQYVRNDCQDPDQTEENCGIIRYIVLIINLLSALVGIVVTASIIFGGIQYSMAGADPQKVTAAKKRIGNSLIALVFFIFTYSFLNYLVPGGVL